MLRRNSVLKVLVYSFLLVSFSSCIINDVIKDTSVLVDPGNDPNFKIVVNKENDFEIFDRKVIVFDIPVYAFYSVDDTKLLHTANILAQYLDNDGDGVIDNLTIHSEIKSKNSFLYLWNTTLEKESFIEPNEHTGFDIQSDKVNLVWHSNGHTGAFDYSLEVAWNLITTNGYEVAYPAIFSSEANSEISIAMDAARGGNFQDPPATYPVNAWYTNSEFTCNYDCQITKYNFWAFSSILGAQENRLTEIEPEWKLNTSTKVQTTDVKAWAIFSNATYNLPSILPDGTYKH